MLNEAQLAQFRNQGFLAIDDVIAPEYLEAVKEEYAARMDELYQGWYNAGQVMLAPEGLSFWDKLDACRQSGVEWYQSFDISLPHADITEDTPMHFGPAIFDIVMNQQVLDIVESVIGSEITSNPIQHVRIKPPQNEVPDDEVRAHITYTDWHQDRGVGSPESDDTEIITVWLAVTDATLDNGCLQVVPGPHDEMLPHCPKSQTAIADGFIDLAKTTPVPVKAGGILLIHPLTPHSSLSNNTADYRWSFDLRYNVTGHPTGRSQFPDFIARSQSDPSSELHDWREWQRLWQAARIQVANSPHIPQHRWTADSPACA